MNVKYATSTNAPRKYRGKGKKTLEKERLEREAKEREEMEKKREERIRKGGGAAANAAPAAADTPTPAVDEEGETDDGDVTIEEFSERQESPEKLASNEALEKLACEALAGMVSDTFSTSEDDDDTSDTKSPEKLESDEALEKLASYVISCGGKRDSLEGWSATHSWHGNSGKWALRFKGGREVLYSPPSCSLSQAPWCPESWAVQAKNAHLF